MITNRVQAFQIAHGIVRKGESLETLLKELTHGDFMPSLLPLHDVKIAVKPESTISALVVESSRREDSQSGESPRKSRKARGNGNNRKAPVSAESLAWLSALNLTASQNRPMPISINTESE